MPEVLTRNSSIDNSSLRFPRAKQAKKIEFTSNTYSNNVFDPEMPKSIVTLLKVNPAGEKYKIPEKYMSKNTIESLRQISNPRE